MSTYTKQFSRADYDKYDGPAKSAIKRYYAAKGEILNDNPDKYKSDLMLENGALIEVTVRNTWKTEAWPYADYSLEIRKAAYKESFDIYTLNSQLTQAVYISAETIFKYRTNVITKTTRYSETPEEFIIIPASELSLVKIPAPPKPVVALVLPIEIPNVTEKMLIGFLKKKSFLNDGEKSFLARFGELIA